MTKRLDTLALDSSQVIETMAKGKPKSRTWHIILCNWKDSKVGQWPTYRRSKEPHHRTGNVTESPASSATKNKKNVGGERKRNSHSKLGRGFVMGCTLERSIVQLWRFDRPPPYPFLCRPSPFLYLSINRLTSVSFKGCLIIANKPIRKSFSERARSF